MNKNPIILGGTFDPPHNGHIQIAAYARQALGAKAVTLLPTFAPPHKPDAAPAAHRLNMAAIAAKEAPGLAVSDMEIRRGGASSYTIDTARALPHGATLIVGADEAAYLPNWKDAAELMKLCAFAIVPRPGADAAAIRDALARDYAARVTLIDMPTTDVSSTDIRGRVERREAVDALVPFAVERYIADNNLYGGGLLALEAPIRERLKAALKPSRFRHTMGVVECAHALAKTHGQDVYKARVAALLHDCAKCLPDADVLALCGDAPLDPAIQAKPNLAHSYAGAALAARDYGISDAGVLAAIQSHTFGRAGMTPLEMVVFVADYIEPTRDENADKAYAKALRKARKLAKADLKAATIFCLEEALKNESGKGRPIVGDSIQALDWLRKGGK